MLASGWLAPGGVRLLNGDKMVGPSRAATRTNSLRLRARGGRPRRRHSGGSGPHLRGDARAYVPGRSHGAAQARTEGRLAAIFR